MRNRGLVQLQRQRALLRAKVRNRDCAVVDVPTSRAIPNLSEFGTGGDGSPLPVPSIDHLIDRQSERGGYQPNPSDVVPKVPFGGSAVKRSKPQVDRSGRVKP